MQYAPIERFVDDPSAQDDDPIIAPFMREQLEPMLGGVRDNGVGGPERALMRAMLQDAILCLLGEAAPAKERPRLASEARFWIASHSREWVYSFESVCDALGYDPDYLRRRLFEMADSRRASAPVVTGEQPACDTRSSLRPVRGLRHSGHRPRRAIHYLSESRRGRKVAEA